MTRIMTIIVKEMRTVLILSVSGDFSLRKMSDKHISNLIALFNFKLAEWLMNNITIPREFLNEITNYAELSFNSLSF